MEDNIGISLTLPYWGFCHTKKLSHKRKINAVRQPFYVCMTENKCVKRMYITIPVKISNFQYFTEKKSPSDSC